MFGSGNTTSAAGHRKSRRQEKRNYPKDSGDEKRRGAQSRRPRDEILMGPTADSCKNAIFPAIQRFGQTENDRRDETDRNGMFAGNKARDDTLRFLFVLMVVIIEVQHTMGFDIRMGRGGAIVSVAVPSGYGRPMAQAMGNIDTNGRPVVMVRHQAAGEHH